MIKLINDNNVKIWDARSNEEYKGEKYTADRNGHIPGAINLDWNSLKDFNNHLKLKPLDEISYMLENAGFKKREYYYYTLSKSSSLRANLYSWKAFRI